MHLCMFLIPGISALCLCCLFFFSEKKKNIYVDEICVWLGSMNWNIVCGLVSLSLNISFGMKKKQTNYDVSVVLEQLLPFK